VLCRAPSALHQACPALFSQGVHSRWRCLPQQGTIGCRTCPHPSDDPANPRPALPPLIIPLPAAPRAPPPRWNSPRRWRPTWPRRRQQGELRLCILLLGASFRSAHAGPLRSLARLRAHVPAPLKCRCPCPQRRASPAADARCDPAGACSTRWCLSSCSRRCRWRAPQFTAGPSSQT
jgi:hypothetical protein